MYGSSSAGAGSGFLEDIPIMISEQYQPKFYTYEVPPAITNCLNLPTDIYQESALFKYDFRQGREVLNNLHEFKRIRQLSKDKRSARKLQLEEKKRQQKLELQQKELAAISYPSTDDFGFNAATPIQQQQHNVNELPIESVPVMSKGPTVAVAASMSNSFYNILQPIVLSSASTTHHTPVHHSMIPSHQKTESVTVKASKATTSSAGRNSVPVPLGPDNSFNIKDFESDTSSPFDNMELKTINDLDILAQVLHNTQVSTKQLPADINIQSDSNSTCEENGAVGGRGGSVTEDCSTKMEVRGNHLFQTAAIPFYNGDAVPSIVDSTPMDKLIMEPHHLAS